MVPAEPNAADAAGRRMRVAVADDHPICAELVVTLLKRMGCEVVGSASDGEAAIALCRDHRPDILLLDVVLPKIGGVQVLQRIRGEGWPVKVILFTGSCTSAVLREALAVGVDGCLIKTSSIDDIMTAVRRVWKGDAAFGPEASELMRQLVVAREQVASLTEAETAALRLFAEGRPVKEIAATLSLSESGVYKLVERVKRKVKAQSVQELTLAAVRRGLVQL